MSRQVTKFVTTVESAQKADGTFESKVVGISGCICDPDATNDMDKAGVTVEVEPKNLPAFVAATVEADALAKVKAVGGIS